MMYNFRKMLLVGLIMFASTVLFAQRIARVKNMEIGIQQNKALIHYELKSPELGSAHSIQLKFLDKEYNLITPTKLTGDVGPNIYSGTGKSIEWEISGDYQFSGSKITPVIFVDGISKEFNRAGGPGNALFSLILPGLGDYFVADQRMMRFKPYLRTATSLGLIGLGIYAGNQLYRAEGEYIQVLRADFWRRTGDDRFKIVYQEGDIQYWWFKGDKELFISMGAAVWAFDVIWVLIRGSNNKRFLKELNRGSEITIGYYQGDISLKYCLTF